MKVIITGNPRSGTSFVCQLVSQMGFNPGSPKNIKPADQYNPGGYWEHIPLASITDLIFQKLNLNFFSQIQSLSSNWQKSLTAERDMIVQTVRSDKVEVYKDNKLMVIADLYSDLFPRAKWLFVSRDFEECYRSRWGEPISLENYIEICAARLVIWRQTRASRACLTIDYNDFKTSTSNTITKIVNYLGVDIANRLPILEKLYKPRLTK